MSAIQEVRGLSDAPSVSSRTVERPAHGRVLGPTVVDVVDGYDLWAPSYDQDGNPLLALEERTLDGQLPSLAGKDVLDVGCGTGRWLQRFLKLGARSATGVDLSPGMLAAAWRKPQLRGRLVRGNCAALPLRSRTAHFIMCSFVASHLSDLTAFAGEVARVAKPHADCYVTDVSPIARARGWRTAFRHASGSAEIATFGRSFDHIRGAFSARGFKLIRFFEPCLGEPERLILTQAGKEHTFEHVVEFAALLVCHFTRLDSDRAAL